jgi:acyl-CoA synthetase (AMP-forming)/AMP-acid ligase II
VPADTAPETAPETVRGDREFATTARLVGIAAERHGDAEAIVDVDAAVTLSFRELADRVRSAAAAFAAAGIEPGDRVGVWAPNIWEWPVAALGAQSAGAILVPLSTRFKGREAAYVLGKSGARALMTVSGFLATDYVAMLREADEPLPALETIVVLRGSSSGTLPWDDFLAGAAEVSEADAAARTDAVRADDVSDILFTSGTTGHPKGVRTTHGQNLRAYWDWATVVGLRAGDRYLVVNPFFHAFGYKAGILAALMKGATLLPHAVFDPQAVLERIPRDRISMLPAPPALFQTILARDDLDHFDLSTLRLSVTGAAAIPTSLIVEMRERLGFETVVTGYGLTEACGIATMCRHDDDPETIAQTSGRAIPGIEVRVVDDDGVEVPRGEPGEIVVRGYNVMLDYFDEPAETAATVDAEGWLHTGDIGVMDERGYVRITDRVKDMFIVGGFNAYPAEIEAMMARHPAIAGVAVVGTPDERLGEVGWAFVVLRDGAATTADEIIEWCRAEMANYKVPRRVEIVEVLPINAAGKVVKYELRERVAKMIGSS